MTASRRLSPLSRRPHLDLHTPTARIRSRWWTALIAILLTTIGSAHQAPPSTNAALEQSAPVANEQPKPAPEHRRHSGAADLSPTAQAQISAVIGEDDVAYHVQQHARGFRVDKASHAVSAEFTSTGVEFSRGDNRWGMTLRGHGYGETLQAALAIVPTAKANRVEYRRGALTEWYVNGPMGLEQGFTLDRAPGPANGQPLTMAFDLSGNLTAAVERGARDLTLSKDGAVVLTYGGLMAWDAEGRQLQTSLEVEGNRLRVRVDDRDAQYPLTIDPLVQARRLTTAIPCSFGGLCDEGEAQNEFGRSVAVSADGSTVVVGVPGKKTNGSITGIAYIFQRPPFGGWENALPLYYTAKLLRTSETLTPYAPLGASVATSNDGGTIVVGAPGNYNTEGVAYVFVRPASGWGSATIHYQTAKLKAQAGYSPGPFGTAVAISGNGARIMVGSTGKVYHFSRPSSGWTNATPTGSINGYTGPNSYFSQSLSLSEDGNTVVVGAPGYDQSIGTAEVYVRQTQAPYVGFWFRMARLIASDAIPGDYVGYSVSISGDGRSIVLGAPTRYTYAAPAREGAAYVFEQPAAGWDPYNVGLYETAKLTASDRQVQDSFGESVAMSRDGNTIAVGASQIPLWTSPATIQGPGAVYAFAKPETGWATATETSKLLASDGVIWDAFGSSTSISGNGRVLVAGAPYKPIGNNPLQGAAYLFTGAALAPVASVSPAIVTFDPEPVGTTSNPKTVSLTNTGNAPLTISSVTVSESFTGTQNCLSASPLAAGASCSESVAFAPTQVGNKVGTIKFITNSGGTSGSLSLAQLQGVGTKAMTSTTITSVSANPALAGQPVTIFFSVLADAPSLPAPSGNVTVQASTGESCTGSAQSGSCQITFAAAGDRSITANYQGDTYFNASTSPSGSLRVVDFSLSASPSSLTLKGKKATYEVNVAALNGFTGTVSLSCTGGPPNTACAVSPASVSLAGSTAPAKATLTLPNGAAAGTYNVTITGSFNGATRTATASLIVK